MSYDDQGIVGRTISKGRNDVREATSSTRWGIGRLLRHKIWIFFLDVLFGWLISWGMLGILSTGNLQYLVTFSTHGTPFGSSTPLHGVAAVGDWLVIAGICLAGPLLFLVAIVNWFSAKFNATVKFRFVHVPAPSIPGQNCTFSIGHAPKCVPIKPSVKPSVHPSVWLPGGHQNIQLAWMITRNSAVLSVRAARARLIGA